MKTQLLLPIALVVSCWMLPAGLSADEEAQQLRNLVTHRSPAICTVKAVLRRDMGMLGSDESTQEFQAVVVDPSGLVVMSNAPLAEQNMSAAGMDLQIRVTPIDFKIVFGNEEKEFPAFLATKDPDLGLAFLQITDLEGRELTTVDFSQGVKLEVGDKLVAVSRLGRGYDYAEHFMTGRVVGKVKKPRRAYMVEGGLAAMGLPVFRPTGEVAGLVTTLKPSVAEAGGGLDLAALLSAFGGTPFVVPAKAIRAKIQQAIPEAQRLLAERKEAESGESTEDSTEPAEEREQ